MLLMSATPTSSIAEQSRCDCGIHRPAFGCASLLSLSILVHFASYPDTDVNDLATNNLIVSILSVSFTYLLNVIILDA
ncbi:DUF2955 domain-containing protein [Vibrio sp. FJH11]